MVKQIACGEGRQSFVAVCKEVIEDPNIQGGVVKNCLEEPEIDMLNAINKTNKQGAVSEAIQTIIPEFATVHQLASKAWARHGYHGYSLGAHLIYTDLVPRGRGIAPHIDYYQQLDKQVQAVLSFSFSVGEIASGAIIKVARPDSSSFTLEDGTISTEAILDWQNRVAVDDIESTDVLVEYGDLFILPQHPTPAGHGVIASTGREAYILDYMAYKIE